MRRQAEIIVVGSANVDYVVTTPRIPEPGETVLAESLAFHEGGKGANQAVAASLAGGAVAFIGALGRDADAARLQASLEGAGVTSSCMEVADQPTGMAMIFVDDAGRNSIAVVPGANSALTPEFVEEAMGGYPEARTLLVQLEIPIAAVEAAIRVASRRGMRVILNPAPARAVLGELLKLVDVLTPNESEAELLAAGVAEQSREASAAQALLATGAGAVVLTRGARGVCIASQTGGAVGVPAFPVEPIDTTAAGDVFSGGLAVALTEGQELAAAARFACAAAAISVTRRGAQRSAPTRAEIEALLEQRD